MAPGRKVPFSGKAKKEQLKAKKLQKSGVMKGPRNRTLLLQKDSDAEEGRGDESKIVSLNRQPHASKSNKANRYALEFHKETKAELEERKQKAQETIVKVPDLELEQGHEDFFPPDLDFPHRPPWNFSMSRDELDAREHRYFLNYAKELEVKYGAKNLSYFELNLETWRQLWRVLEMSDIVLVIADVRFPCLMFPPSVYKFVCEKLNKNMILVLNKVDLAPPALVVAWKYYFLKHFPTLHIITFTSFPLYNLRNATTQKKSGLQVRRMRGKPKMAAEAALTLFEACKDITKEHVNLDSWSTKIHEEMSSGEGEEEWEVQVEEGAEAAVEDTHYEEHVKYKSGILTIGCIGQPNVGKSSLINALMGKKVVSVSRTPGHTKHFQTIYLTPNVRLCDCPGLVFPSRVPRPLQILAGSYPIAQVREPYSAVQYLAERMDLPALLVIPHPENDDTWSAMDICDGWAKKRGFYTAKAARLDTYRAANNLLRMFLEGQICLCLRPPGYSQQREEWEKHPEVAEITWIQAKKMDPPRQLYELQESEEEEESTQEEDDEEEEEGSEEEELPTSKSNKFALLDTSE